MLVQATQLTRIGEDRHRASRSQSYALLVDRILDAVLDFHERRADAIALVRHTMRLRHRT